MPDLAVVEGLVPMNRGGRPGWGWQLAMGCGVLGWWTAWEARAVLRLDPGDIVLHADRPGQAVTLFLENLGEVPESVRGIDLALESGDGGPGAGGSVMGPVLSGLELGDGSLFAGYAARRELDPASSGQQQFWTITVPGLGILPSVPARSRVPLVTLEWDTSGLGTGVFDFRLRGTGLGDTAVYDGFGFHSPGFDVGEGRLRLVPGTAVPEGGVGGWLWLALVLIVRWRRTPESDPLPERRAGARPPSIRE